MRAPFGAHNFCLLLKSIWHS